MRGLTPRKGGNFRRMEVLNREEIRVKELADILYYERFPEEYKRQKQEYKRRILMEQDEYQRSSLKKGA